MGKVDQKYKLYSPEPLLEVFWCFFVSDVFDIFSRSKVGVGAKCGMRAGSVAWKTTYFKIKLLGRSRISFLFHMGSYKETTLWYSKIIQWCSYSKNSIEGHRSVFYSPSI